MIWDPTRTITVRLIDSMTGFPLLSLLISSHSLRGWWRRWWLLRSWYLWWRPELISISAELLIEAWNDSLAASCDFIRAASLGSLSLKVWLCLSIAPLLTCGGGNNGERNMCSKFGNSAIHTNNIYEYLYRKAIKFCDRYYDWKGYIECKREYLIE